MDTGAREPWQDALEHWFETLRHVWGLDRDGATPPLEVLREAWTAPATQSPATARATRDALRSWRGQLPEELPPWPGWRDALSAFEPLATLLAPAGGEAAGPAGAWLEHCATLERGIRRWQRTALALAGELAGILADGLDDFAAGGDAAGTESTASRLTRWSTCVESRYEQALTEGPLADRLADYGSAAALARNALTALMDELAPSLGLPSRAELADTQARLARLERLATDGARPAE